MNPGRELDALVAEKVMGRKVEAQKYTGELGCPIDGRGIFRIPDYSTDISDAWRVVERMRNNPPENTKEMGAELTIEVCEDGWWVGWRWHEWTEDGARGDTAPHAICLAALKVVGAL